MADNVSLYGFRFVKTVTGKNTPNILEAEVATGYQASPGGTDVDLNVGDPIQRLSTGYVSLAVANTEILGVCAGFRYWDGTKLRYGNKLPGATAWGTIWERRSIVYYIPSAGSIFEIDCDENTTATTEAGYLAFYGENADLSINADATADEARPLLDISDHKTATAQLRLLGPSKTTQNRDFSGARVKMLVTVNESSFKSGGDSSTDGV